MRNRFLAVFAFVAMTGGVTLMATTPASATGAAPIAAPVSGKVPPVAHPKKPPVVAGQYVKGIPTATTEKAAKNPKASKLTTNFFYTGAHSFLGAGPGNGGGAGGFATLESNHKPVLGSGDFHSLYEISAQSRDNQQIMEVGYTVDPGLNGDSNPHLFIYHWINNQTTCYNGCGWVDNPLESVGAGTSVAFTASGSAPSIYYQYRLEHVSSTPSWAPAGTGGGWVASQTNQGQTQRILGMMPDTEWTGSGVTFVKADLIQSFGELATNSTTPCGDMGSGAFGTSTLPSSAADQLAMSLLAPVPNDPGTGIAETNNWDTVDVAPTSATPTAFRVFDGAGYATPDTDRFRWGGPGYNASGTGTGSIGSC